MCYWSPDEGNQCETYPDCIAPSPGGPWLQLEPNKDKGCECVDSCSRRVWILATLTDGVLLNCNMLNVSCTSKEFPLVLLWRELPARTIVWCGFKRCYDLWAVNVQSDKVTTLQYSLCHVPQFRSFPQGTSKHASLCGKETDNFFPPFLRLARCGYWPLFRTSFFWQPCFLRSMLTISFIFPRPSFHHSAAFLDFMSTRVTTFPAHWALLGWGEKLCHLLVELLSNI